MNSIHKAAAILLFAPVLLGIAPFQCASTRSTPRVHEDDPAGALWRLAERLHDEGNETGYRTALDELVQRYPDSRHAPEARERLSAAR